MKKIYTLVLIAIGSGAFAQSFIMPNSNGITTTSRDFPISAKAAAEGDTLGVAEFAPSGQVINYGYATGGYIFGVNAASFQQAGQTIWQAGTGCARGFVLNDSPSYISGALVLLGNKYQSSATNNSKIVAKVTKILSNKALATQQSQAADTIGPNSVALATGEITLADADTTFGVYNLIPFASSAMVTEDFAITLDYASCLLNSDTVSVLADADGDGGNIGYTWGRLSFWVGATIAGNPTQGAWAYTAAFLQTPLDVNIAIFALVGGPSAIEEQSFFDGLKLGQSYPNPSVDNAKVEIELQNAAKEVTLKVIDIKGRTLMTSDFGSQSAGKHSFDLNVSELASGSYYYMLSADGRNIVKQMSIVK